MVGWHCGGVNWHSHRTFPLQWKQSNQLNHSEEFTSLPPCPTPFSTTITLPYQSPEFRASLLFQEWKQSERRRGRGQDRSSTSRPKTEFAFISVWCGCGCVCKKEKKSVRFCAHTSACLLLKKYCRKLVQILMKHWLGLPHAAVKTSNFAFHRQTMVSMGSESSREILKQVHSAVRS